MSAMNLKLEGRIVWVLVLATICLWCGNVSLSPGYVGNPDLNFFVASSEGLDPPTSCFVTPTRTYITRSLAGDGMPGGVKGILDDTTETYNFDNVAPLDDLQMSDLVWISPSNPDYANLRLGVAANGVLELYAANGGTLVINALGNGQNSYVESNIAVGGVDYIHPSSIPGAIEPGANFGTVAFAQPCHPFLTGQGFGGTALILNDFFNAGGGTGYGYLSGFDTIPGAIVILETEDGFPVMVEYPWGLGRVIVTSLNFGVNCSLSNLFVASENLMDYAASDVRSNTHDTDGDNLIDLEECAQGTDLNDPDSDNDGLSDGDEVNTYLTNPLDPNSDGDTLTDGDEVLVYGTNPLVADSDNDGLNDDTEINTGINGCPDPLNPYSDSDAFTDGQEVALGTNPCDPDTDGDGLADDVDPDPLNPGTLQEIAEAEAREVADTLSGFLLDQFTAPNNNSNAGRQNALANRANRAGNLIAEGNLAEAVHVLESLLARIDGHGPQPDWMELDDPARIALAEQVTNLITLLESEIANP